ALRHLEHFPIDINKAPLHILIRIPGIGVRGAQKILQARRFKSLTFEDLKQLKIPLKRARYFIVAGKSYQKEVPLYEDRLKIALINHGHNIIQPSLLDLSIYTGEL
nr:biotin synthase [Sulfurospirillum sp.]